MLFQGRNQKQTRKLPHTTLNRFLTGLLLQNNGIQHEYGNPKTKKCLTDYKTNGGKALAEYPHLLKSMCYVYLLNYLVASFRKHPILAYPLSDGCLTAPF